MIVSIMQPAYLPWLGYFDRIGRADLHVVLDHVQLEKRGFTRRNRVRTPEGWSWLSVPVLTKGRSREVGIDALEIADDSDWARKHRETIRRCYSGAAYFDEHFPALSAILDRRWERLVDLTGAIADWQLGTFGIGTPHVASSAFGIASSKGELILDLCRAVGATTYLSGPFGRDYLDEERFAGAGIAVAYHDYVHPVYEQRHAGFEPFMAAIDLLFEQGPASAAILRSGSTNGGATRETAAA
jgi:hypothetical protein